jgi:predicted Fe-S protein YdhL (DUF1289 family)
MSIQSPCVHVCEMSQDKDVCLGCNRTLAEIANWSRLTDTQKISVILDAQQRRLMSKCEMSLENRDE